MLGRANPRFAALKGTREVGDWRPGAWIMITPIAPYFCAADVFENGLK